MDADLERNVSADDHWSVCGRIGTFASRVSSLEVDTIAVDWKYPKSRRIDKAEHGKIARSDDYGPLCWLQELRVEGCGDSAVLP